MTTLSAWSYSRLEVFEKCPLQAKLRFVDKIPEPERPLPPGKTEHANDRGTRVHEGAEFFIKSNVELLPELASFEHELKALKELYKSGKVSLEGEWGITKEWTPTGWLSPNVWCRVKLDAFVNLDPEHAVVIDFKTGRLSGNEVKHMQQGQLYALGTHVRYPNAKEIRVEFWYTDQDDVRSTVYTQKDMPRLREGFHERGLRLTEATEWPAKPSMFNCKWCPYGPAGTGHCTVGIQKPRT